MPESGERCALRVEIADGDRLFQVFSWSETSRILTVRPSLRG